MTSLGYRILSTLEQLKIRCKIYVFPIRHSLSGVYNGIIIRVSKNMSHEDVLRLLDPINFCQISVVHDLNWWECLFKKKHLSVLSNPKVFTPPVPKVDEFDEELKILKRISN